MSLDMGWDDLTKVFKADGKLSVWKLMGGAAVVSVVAPAGAAMAAVAATGMLAANAAMSLKDAVVTTIEARGERRGEASATAKHAVAFAKLKNAFEAQVAKYKEQDRYFELMLAMHAVGMACAACDGIVTDEERQDIEEFIGGTSLMKAPSKVREKLDELSRNPPSLATAFALAGKFDAETLVLFDDIIELVIQADGHVDPAEERFCLQWRGLRAAA